jgi:hypothetical protein
LAYRELRIFGEIEDRCRSWSSTPVVRVCFRVSARNSRTHMASVLPFRPWFFLTPRVFNFRTMRALSTDPTCVLSYTFTPPQWLSPNRVVSTPKTASTPFLARDSSIQSATLQHAKAPEPFFSPKKFPAFERCCLVFQKSHPQGLATLSMV